MKKCTRTRFSLPRFEDGAYVIPFLYFFSSLIWACLVESMKNDACQMALD